VSSFDLEHWAHVAVATLDGDDAGDLVFGAGDGSSSQVAWLRANGTSLSSPTVIVDVPSTEIDLSGGRMVVGKMTASGATVVSLQGGSPKATDLDPVADPSSVSAAVW